jgi:hypothetical protein
MISFDNSPRIYFLIANFLLFLVAMMVVVAYIKPRFLTLKSWKVSFVLLNILVMVLMRLPFMVYNQDMHPDESEMTAGAMALGRNMTFWGQVDGMTSGLFNFYPLVFFSKLFAQPFDYTSSRIVGTLLLSGSLAFFFFSVQNLFSSKYAFISLLLVSSFLGITNSVELLHYSSEYVSVFLINLLCWQFSRIYCLPKPTATLLFLHGFVAPITIFAKLQATPIAFCCVLVSVVFLFFKFYKQSPKQFLKYTAIICSGCVCYLVAMCALTLYYQVFDDMITLYFVNNLGYGSAGKFKLFDFNYFYKTLFYDFDYIIVLRSLVLFLVLFIVSEIVAKIAVKRQSKALIKIHWPTFFVLTLILFSVFSAFKTGFLFGHYLNFLIFPAGLMFVLLLNSIDNIIPQNFNKVIVTAITVCIFCVNCHYPLTNSYISADQSLRPLPLSGTSLEILKYIRPSEPLAVWGNGSRYHLETQLVQATRWNFTLFDPYTVSQKAFLHNEYLEDMKRSNVPVFVDSYAIQERACHGHEVVPKIRNWIQKKYTKVADIDQSRIYIRNDRYQSLSETNAP